MKVLCKFVLKMSSYYLDILHLSIGSGRELEEKVAMVLDSRIGKTKQHVRLKL
jgi:hypothetical protein